MPYLNQHVYSEQDLGLSFDDITSKIGSALKSGSNLYQLTKQQKEQQELAKMQAASPSSVQPYREEGFLQKHGLKLAIGAGGLLVLFLVLKKKG